MKKIFKVKLTEQGINQWDLSKRKLRETYNAMKGVDCNPGGIIIFVSKKFIRKNDYGWTSWSLKDNIYGISKHYQNKYSEYGFWLNEGDYRYV